MATRAACASTAFTTATTWATVDATSFNSVETTSTALTTSYQTSSTFTPGAITIDGIGVRLSVRTGTTGTITVALDQATADVAGTVVTINCSDLPAAVSALLDGGWIFFKFAAPVTLAGATAYGVKAKTSSAAQVSLFSTATTNWARFLRTTTTGAPAAGDDLIIAKEWTAAGTGTARSVTMDQTAATDYGSAPTAALGLVTPGIAICQGGDLTYGSTSTINYLLQLSNSLIVYNGGTLNIGTTGTPIPRDGSAVLQFDLAADGDYGLVARNGSTVNLQGLSRTIAKNVVSAKMTADAAASGGAPSTSTLSIDTDTGWLSTDIIAVASTSRTAADCEVGTLNANAGASSIVVKDMTAGAAGMAVPPTSNRGLLVAHSGTSPTTQAEVILLTRNVRVRSTSATLMTYVQIKSGAVVDIDWAEFYYLGTSTTGQKGVDVEVNTTAATNFSMQFSSVHDIEVGGFSATVTAAGGTLTALTFSSNTLWNLSTTTGPGINISAAITATGWTLDSNILLRTGNSNGATLTDVGGTFTNNTVVGAASNGINLSEAAALGTFSGNVTHSNTNIGLNSSTAFTGTILNYVGWRNTSVAINFNSSAYDVIVDGAVLFGNAVSNFAFTASIIGCQIKNCTFNGDTTFSTPSGIKANIAGGCNNILIDNCDFSTVSGIKTAHTTGDIDAAATPTGFLIILRNTKLGAATEVATPSNLTNNSFIASEKHDQTAGNHMTWMKNGKVQTDAVIFNTLSPSMRMTPTSASLKLESAPQFQGMKVAVASGGTVTIAVYTRKSVVGDGTAYNGNQPLLYLKANPAIGITTDALIATASAAAGSWGQISGATAAATDDGVMEFVIQVDGTTGWVNVDDWSAS